MIASLVVGSRPYSALGLGTDADPTGATMYSSVFITICLYLPWGKRSGGRRMTPSSCSWRMSETYRMLAHRVVTSSAVVNTGRRPSGCIRRNCYGRSAHSSRYRSESACSSASRSTSVPVLLTRRILSYRPTSRRHLGPVAGSVSFGVVRIRMSASSDVGRWIPAGVENSAMCGGSDVIVRETTRW